MNDRTNSTLVLSIGIMLAVFAIPQLLFSCAAPEAPCRTIVYIYMTVYSLAHLLLCFGLWQMKGMRIAAAPIVLNSLFFTAELIACFVLLMLKPSTPVAATVLSILGLIHFLVESTLCSTLER